MIDMEIEEIFDSATSVIIYNDGVKKEYAKGGEEFEKILLNWNDMLVGCHPMPAFGVSIDRETVKEMKSGLWAEFVFGQTLEYNGMPFENLLVKVVGEYCGFNLIRYNAEHGYDGRCYYIDLVNKNMSDFYDFLVDL